MTVEHPVDPIEVAEVRVPFFVERSAAEASLRGWLGKRGYFAPASLSSEAVVETIAPLCWAGWIVNAQAMVAWTADSDEGSRRSAWAPHSGQVPLRFDNIVVPASRGLRHHECRMLVPYYDLSKAVPVDAPAIPGEIPAMIESFDAQRSAARRVTTGSKRRRRPASVHPGRRFRNVHVACMLERQTHRVAAGVGARVSLPRQPVSRDRPRPASRGRVRSRRSIGAGRAGRRIRARRRLGIVAAICWSPDVAAARLHPTHPTSVSTVRRPDRLPRSPAVPPYRARSTSTSMPPA
jgi:hypothetical protein